MNLTKEQIEAGLRACNHFAEAYPEELTPELYYFILVLEKESKYIDEELTRCEDYHSHKAKCSVCNDVGIVENRLQDSEDESVIKTFYNPCPHCDVGIRDVFKRINEQ